MNYNGRLYIRVGSKGAVAFVRFNDGIQPGLRYEFTVVWSCGDDRLPTGETGVATADEILEMVEEDSLLEINESTSQCQAATA